MIEKKQSRIRRAKKSRGKIRTLEAVRLSVHRTPRHIYAQVVTADGSRILASASTLDKELRASISQGGNVTAAVFIGKTIAERAKKQGIETVAFDRGGLKYHGRVKALADAAREQGLKF